MTKGNCMINPNSMPVYNKLRSACYSYKDAVKMYGADSTQAKSAFDKRKSIEAEWGVLKGVVKANNPSNGISLNEAKNTVNSLCSKVHSWYV